MHGNGEGSRDKTAQARSVSAHALSQSLRWRGRLAREGALIAAFLTLQKPTSAMQEEAASAGFYEPDFMRRKKYRKLPILTVEELRGGKQLQYPRLQVATFKRAERKAKRRLGQRRTFGEE